MIPYHYKVVRSFRALHLVCARAGFVAVALLLGCGSQEPAPSGVTELEGWAAPVDSASPEDARSVLVAFGDSLTAGQGVSREATYPAFLQRELNRRGLEFRVVNEGVSGDTTAKAMSRVSVALAHDPEWVILALGANDGLRGLPVDDMERNLRQMVERFQKGGARVLLAGMMLPRNYGPEYVRAFEAVYPRLAKDRNLPLIPFLLENVAMVRELNNRDGIHPNAAGNEIIARQVADAFEAIAEE